MEFFTNFPIRITTTLVIVMIIWLPIVLSLLWDRRKFAEQVEERDYELRQPKFAFWLGFVCALILTIPVIIGPVIGDETFFPAGAIFFGVLALLGSFLAVYGIQWRITVRHNRLIVRRPFKVEREITIEEITNVVKKMDGIIVYVDGKRSFAVEENVPGFRLIQAQLYAAGKLKPVQEQDVFVVRQHKVNLVIGILGILFFGGMSVRIVFWWGETYFGFVCMLVLAPFCSFIYLVVKTLRWRLTVKGDTLMVRGIIGEEKSYPIKSIIRRGYVRSMCIALYTDRGKIAEVSPLCKNFPILSERLRLEEIKFMDKGKPVE